MRTVLIGVDEVRRETDLALLLVIDGDEVWCPKSQIEDADDVSVGDEEIELNIAQWWCEQEGLV